MTKRVGLPLPEVQAPITVQIRGILGHLQPAMRRVGEFIVENSERVASMTISDLANQCHTSETTVVRFCRELGVRGYAQLRVALATEVGSRSLEDAKAEASGDISDGDDLASVVEKIAYTDARSVIDTAQALSIPELAAVVERILVADRIDIYGVGASGIVGLDLQQKLHRIGLISFALSDIHQALASASLLTEKSVVIGISHSGTTTDTIEMLARARENGATVVAITNSPRSPLAEIADHVLTTAARETPFRAGATGSRLAQLTVVDCLFVGVAQSNYSQSIEALETTRNAVRSRHITKQKSPRK
ncbi:MurR/RpiR family transcriptional regulator [Timonella senegalensis]|uniref:MurR/RpiR family transcriptional regulator n=1 Tax=Timonella senegalensis TaxID=1465825 RepID=UPI00030C3615|nr:MurR/RpiR family transcriptional regulator [Timonella senegalensis]